MGKERGLICKGNEIITCSAVLTALSLMSCAGRGLEVGAMRAPWAGGLLCRSRDSLSWGSCSPPRGLGWCPAHPEGFGVTHCHGVALLSPLLLLHPEPHLALLRLYLGGSQQGVGSVPPGRGVEGKGRR